MRLTLPKPHLLVIGGSLAVILVVGNLIVRNAREASADTAQIAVSSDSLTTLLHELTPPTLTPISTPAGKPLIYAKSYIVLDGESRLPLLAKSPDMAIPIASTTKIMTALVVLDTLPLDKVVTIPREAAIVEGSEIQLLTGEKMTVKNLLYALMLNSANDGALALSMAGGTTEEFVALMNKKAKQLGLQNTEYKDPVGLNDDGRSSARDLALLTSHALSHELFSSIVKTPTYTVWSADNKYKHELLNSNQLLQSDHPNYLASAIGIKTGFTYDAGHCLVAATDVNGKRYIAVILHTAEDTKSASAKEARKLLTWANQGH